MINIYDKPVAFPQYVKFLKNQDNVIIINGYTGFWGLIDTNTLDKINHCIQNEISPAAYISSFENVTERQQLAELFQTLFEEKMIRSSDNQEFEIDIKDVEFKLTNKCNLKCIHCAACSDINQPDVLSTEQVKMILDKIFNLSKIRLIMTGGEVLIRKDIKELLQYARKNYKGEINILTNGTLIDREMAFLLKECVSDVSISVDGYDEESTDFVRGRGTYNKIMHAIDYLREAGFGKDTIILSMTCINQNLKHAEDFNKMCEKLNVMGGVRQFAPSGRGLDNFESIGVKNYLAYSPDSMEELETIRENLNCKIFCRAGITKLSINEAGNMYPCLFLEKEEYKFGNILENDVNEILKSKAYHELIRNKLGKSILDTMDKCKDCNVRYFCSDSCAGMNDSYFNNKEICEERCKQMKPYLTKVVWDE